MGRLVWSDSNDDLIAVGDPVGRNETYRGPTSGEEAVGKAVVKIRESVFVESENDEICGQGGVTKRHGRIIVDVVRLHERPGHLRTQPLLRFFEHSLASTSVFVQIRRREDDVNPPTNAAHSLADPIQRRQGAAVSVDSDNDQFHAISPSTAPRYGTTRRNTRADSPMASAARVLDLEDGGLCPALQPQLAQQR